MTKQHPVLGTGLDFAAGLFKFRRRLISNTKINFIEMALENRIDISPDFCI